MEILLTAIHLIACFLLIVIVLLQKGKGADLSGAFGGGGSQANVGARTGTQVIHKLTIAAAIFFMITSYSLGLQGTGKTLGEILEERQGTPEEQATEESGEAGKSEETKPEGPAVTGGEEESPPAPAEASSTEGDEQKPAPDADKENPEGQAPQQQ
jgi:preprotein translocase subunit SecG